MRPLRSRILRCFVTAGPLMRNGRMSSFTEVSPRERRVRIARRVGSAKAKKVVLRVSVGMDLFNLKVK